MHEPNVNGSINMYKIHGLLALRFFLVQKTNEKGKRNWNSGLDASPKEPSTATG